MARAPVIAAGGIVMRRDQPPLIAVVRPRKREEWVLPKGKLDDGETPRAAARREVLEETGHNVTVHEFLGTLVYESGGRPKVVHYWRMEAGATQARELMGDIRAVDWLPLDAAIARLSRLSERAFLENVGPLAVSVLSRRLKAKAQVPAVKAPPAKKRRVKVPAVAPQLPPSEPLPEISEQAELEPAPQPMAREVPAEAPVETPVPDAALVEEAEFIPQADVGEDDAASAAAPEPESGDASPESAAERQSLVQKVRNWLGRAA
ncbi:MAG TPA: NUDIX domain-containing protein [Bradyrhizobium sp.]|uniref:NUDIX hydrolase n=1 Tax=Bradyrhizobium sp. TaxID=376 RepID=UPI002CBB2695|nr:NUDIX domain-containing protein [Bradyrhizobium sp.]HLZ02587.1 NUDIX domain-containing protein [Bradyrhizobium sp.]